MKKVVITNTLGYLQLRNFAGLPFKKYKIRKRHDLYKILFWGAKRFYRTTNKYWLNLYYDLDLYKGDLCHFFNTLSRGRRPWITSFSSCIPRFGNVPYHLAKFGVELLVRDQCKKIIAISKNAKLVQEKFIGAEFPKYEEKILSKLCIVHPTQKLNIKKYCQKKIGCDTISFTVVGKEFFRKGGMEILRVLNEVNKQKKKIKLNIISSIKYGDYATKSTEQDYKKALFIIKENYSWINHFDFLPNNMVLEILKNSHVALLPSYDDSYGYSVLEAQSNGCPVITTDIRALTEINNNDIGWLIKVPKNCYNYSEINSREKRSTYSKIIENNLFKIISEILFDPTVIYKKGIKCIDNIVKFHNPKTAVYKLEGIYDSILEKREISSP